MDSGFPKGVVWHTTSQTMRDAGKVRLESLGWLGTSGSQAGSRLTNGKTQPLLTLLLLSLVDLGLWYGGRATSGSLQLGAVGSQALPGTVVPDIVSPY